MNSDGSAKRKIKTLTHKHVFIIFLAICVLHLLPWFKCLTFRACVETQAILYLFTGLAAMIGLNTDIKYTTYRRVLYYVRIEVSERNE